MLVIVAMLWRCFLYCSTIYFSFYLNLSGNPILPGKETSLKLSVAMLGVCVSKVVRYVIYKEMYLYTHP